MGQSYGWSLEGPPLLSYLDARLSFEQGAIIGGGPLLYQIGSIIGLLLIKRGLSPNQPVNL